MLPVSYDMQRESGSEDIEQSSKRPSDVEPGHHAVGNMHPRNARINFRHAAALSDPLSSTS